MNDRNQRRYHAPSRLRPFGPDRGVLLAIGSEASTRRMETRNHESL